MADQPSPARLLREDRHPWFFLADGQGLGSALTEVGSSDELPGLASLVVAYGPPDAPAVQVGWLQRPHRPELARTDDDQATRTDLARRLVFTIFAALERQGTDRGETVRRINADPPRWATDSLRVDGTDHPAWTATAADDQLTYAHLEAQTVFVQTSRWHGSTALVSTLKRPALPDA